MPLVPQDLQVLLVLEPQAPLAHKDQLEPQDCKEPPDLQEQLVPLDRKVQPVFKVPLEAEPQVPQDHKEPPEQLVPKDQLALRVLAQLV